MDLSESKCTRECIVNDSLAADDDQTSLLFGPSSVAKWRWQWWQWHS